LYFILLLAQLFIIIIKLLNKLAFIQLLLYFNLLIIVFNLQSMITSFIFVDLRYAFKFSFITELKIIFLFLAVLLKHHKLILQVQNQLDYSLQI